MKRRQAVRHAFAAAGAAMVVAAAPLACAAAPDAGCEDQAVRPPRFDAAGLREGRFIYRITPKSGPPAEFVLTIRRGEDGAWRLTGDAVGFDQHWEAVTTRRFEPVSALLTLTRKGRPYRMELAYAGGQVAVAETADAAASPPDVRRTTAELTAPTVDQRIDWASVMASDLQPGEHAAYRVFDAATGSSRIDVAARRGPVMDGPLGRRGTLRLDYRICKAGRPEPERYTVFATRERPRVMLREDLRGDEVTELVRVEP